MFILQLDIFTFVLLYCFLGKCYTTKIDSFRGKVSTLLLLNLVLIRDTLIIERNFIADNYSQILRFESQ